MESFPFERLPIELKIKIIRLAIPSTPARFVRNGFQVCLVNGWGHEDEEELRRFRASCPEIKAICDQIRYFVVCLRGKAVYRLDPLHDTFKINVPVPWYLSGIPQKKRPESSQQAGLPIRRMVYWTLEPWISTEAQGSVPSDARETFSQLPFDSSLPIWQYTPKLKAFTLVIDKCDWSWHIESFQQYGPGTSARNNIHSLLPYGFTNAGSLRLQSDTGITWMLDPTRTLHHYGYPGDPLTSSPSAFWPYPPMIGLHGYSRGSRSQGGKWAGFRYWTETKKIEFRPLSWPEVEDAMEDRQRDRRWHHEFVARLWINRPGEPVDTEQSQYGWVEVKAPEKGDARWVEQVATTWKMVRYTLMRMDEAIKIDWHLGNA
ncbi:hypothetical protein FVEG_09345 [Fusarium verticillioides 7600]|uniref:Uncharacterized protein n=1 Tax=Gibberella moniliformis (strain M3125 / FGSC 7600) TaxID=334819 RepID=W7N005_GIBM7|nr:hypothetical protein FVEG_09345 [Fusarium verticillioides 7600]EWG50007.1 hypothetical protein FVEG_09345 [Fusarium verticillioides 7600]